MPHLDEGAPSTGSLPFRVCLYFIVNPEECLYTADIAEKFESPRYNVHNSLRRAVAGGWLNCVKEKGAAIYTPGPTLLAAGK